MSTKAEKAGQTVSPALDPAATICTMKEAARILRASKVVTYRHIRDGLLQTFRVGTRRYCTVAQIQDCVRALAERGAEKTFKPTVRNERGRAGKPKHQERAARAR
jgi:hypothetical protein